MVHLGMPELIIILIIPLVGAVTIIPLWQICKKAGYSPALGFLGIIPLANVCLMFFLAFAEWPTTRELRELRQNR